MGVNLGTSAIPKYQDFAVKFNLPFNKGGNLSLWALGGDSQIDILISEQTKDEVDLYGENTKDQRFGTNMLVSVLLTPNLLMKLLLLNQQLV